MAGSMETIFPDLVLLGPIKWRRIHSQPRRNRLMEPRLKARYQWNAGQLLGHLPHRGDVRRIMCRGDFVHFFHRLEYFCSHALYAAHATAMHGFESDRSDFLGLFQAPAGWSAQ